MSSSLFERAASLRLYTKATGGEAVVFFPYAGGTARAGQRLLESLPAGYDGVALQYPGKGDRKREPEPADIEALARHIAEDLREAGMLDGRALTFYGHSMGAAVAFETARRLESAGATLKRLCVSGRRAPSASLGFSLPLDDAVILEQLQTSGGIAPAVLQSPKIRASLIDGVRNDYRINIRYRTDVVVRLRTPIRFLLADADNYVSADEAGAWATHTECAFDLRTFHGGHFFIDQNLQGVADALG